MALGKNPTRMVGREPEGKCLVPWERREDLRIREAVYLNAAFFKNLLEYGCRVPEGKCAPAHGVSAWSGLEHATCVTNPCWVKEQGSKCWEVPLVTPFILRKGAGSTSTFKSPLLKGPFTDTAYSLFYSSFLSPPKHRPQKCPCLNQRVIVKLCSHLVSLLLD